MSISQVLGKPGLYSETRGGGGGRKKPTIIKVKKSRMRVYRRNNVKERNNKTNKQTNTRSRCNQSVWNHKLRHSEKR